jgi:hypothetical protein
MAQHRGCVAADLVDVIEYPNFRMADREGAGAS